MSDQGTVILDRFRQMAGRLILLDRKLALLESDGWPANTGYDKVSRGQSELTPTEAAAHARMNGKDPAIRARRQLQGLIRRLENQVGKHLDGAKWVDGGEVIEAPDVFCVSCERVTLGDGSLLSEPRYRGDLCRRCYDWTRAHNGVWPPGGLCYEWSKGVKMTPDVVTRWEGIAKRERRETRT